MCACAQTRILPHKVGRKSTPYFLLQHLTSVKTNTPVIMMHFYGRIAYVMVIAHNKWDDNTLTMTLNYLLACTSGVCIHYRCKSSYCFARMVCHHTVGDQLHRGRTGFLALLSYSSRILQGSSKVVVRQRISWRPMAKDLEYSYFFVGCVMRSISYLVGCLRMLLIKSY